MPAIQDAIPNNYCWGCGPLNTRGLHLKSFWQTDVTVSDFQPLSEHMAGPKHILNGGIIATLCDCHSVCTAIADAYRQERREVGEPPDIWYATGGLSIRYLRPTPLGQAVHLRAAILERTAKKAVVSCTLASAGEVTVEAEVIAVRVPESWRHGKAP